MELVAFLAVGLVLGAVAIYAEWFEPSPARTATPTAMTAPAAPPPVDVAQAPVQERLPLPPMIEPAAGPTPPDIRPVQQQPVQPAIMMVPRPEPIELPAARGQPSRQERPPVGRGERTRQAAVSDLGLPAIEPAAGPTSSQSRRAARPRGKEAHRTQRPVAPVQSAALAQQPLVQTPPATAPIVQQGQPDRSRPGTRNPQGIYAADSPEGLMDLACFELINGDRSFAGPENGAFLAKFDIERVGVTCRYGVLQGPATYVLSPNRIYGFNGTIWANVWRMLPQEVRELRVRFEPREPSPDRRPRSPRRSSVWDGDAVGFDPQGRVLLMARFDQGNFDGPLQVRSPTGTTVFSGAFKALPEGGVPHGVFDLSNQSGRLIARRYFCNGYPVGVHQFYSTRGETIAREDYRSIERPGIGECPWLNESGAAPGRRPRNSGA